ASDVEGVDPDALGERFRLADRERTGRVRLRDLDGGTFKPLRRIFSLADRDGDGQLTREELDGYVELRRLAQVGVVTLTVDDQERGWFDILDADHDGRLSVPELRDAWRRLADAAADKRGFLTLRESASAYTLTFSRGPRSAAGMSFLLTPRKTPRKGPLWFRK